MTFQNTRRIASLIALILSVTCFPQDPPSPMFAPPPPLGLPIDGGVLIAAFVAVCYGVKKIIKK